MLETTEILAIINIQLKDSTKCRNWTNYECKEFNEKENN